MTDLDQLIQKLEQEGHICPKPNYWNKFWSLLPGRRRKGLGYEPPAPLILGAWHHTSHTEKHQRFFVHLQWAQDHGVLEEMADFLGKLGPDDWHKQEQGY